jgi:hypothetical protein
MKRLLFCLTYLLWSGTALCQTEFGTVDEIEGSAYIVNSAGQQMPVKLWQAIHTGETVHTATNSELHITSSDGGLIALRPNSSFQVDEYIATHSPEDKVILRLIKGGMRSVTGWIPKHHPESYEVRVSTAFIGIRGTDHEVHLIETGQHEAGVHNHVHEGATVLRNASGEVHIGAGQFAHAPHDDRQAPALLMIKPRFYDDLMLKIEHRLEQRKEELKHLLDEIRDAWLSRFGRDA